jgi:hypothetical protein
MDQPLQYVAMEKPHALHSQDEPELRKGYQVQPWALRYPQLQDQGLQPSEY